MLTIGELADKLNVSSSTIRKWTINGRISAKLTDGGHRRYIYEDVITALESENPNIPKKCLIYINIKDLKKSNEYLSMANFYAKSNNWNIVKTFCDYTGKLDSMNELFEEIIRLIISDKVNRVIFPYKTLLGMHGKQQTLEIVCRIKRVKFFYLEDKLNYVSSGDIKEVSNIKKELVLQHKEQ